MAVTDPVPAGRFTWSIALAITDETYGKGMRGYRETAVRADGLEEATTRAIMLVDAAKAAGETRPIEIVGIWQADSFELVAWVNAPR